MFLVGINAYHGDAAAVVVADGKLLFAAEEERFNRMKHSAGLPQTALRKGLAETGISLDDLDYVSISRDPTANFFPKIQFVLKNHPPLSFLKDRLRVAMGSREILKKMALLTSTLFPTVGSAGFPPKAGQPLAENLRYPRGESVRNGRFHAKPARVEHHLSHAASAFYPSGFDRSALLTVDGFGDFSSTMFGIGEGNRIKVLKRVLFPHSLGILYTAATQFLGFPKYGDEYKVMGLAAHGEPRFLKEFRELIQTEPDGTFKLNLDYFTHPQSGADMTWSKGEPVLGISYSEKWRNLFGSPRSPDESITPRHKDLAASVQAIFEEVFFHLLNRLYEKTHLKTLCLAGGCVQNSVANGKIFDRTPFEQVYIQPAAGDAGTALGSALYTAHHRFNQPRTFVMDHAYWGPEFSEQEISEELDRRQMTGQRIKDEVVLCQKTAKAIAEGKIVGWFQGRMEWGPRALGNRSILADPRRAEMKDILNARIKHRENFRPFAPSVLEEKADEWFEMKTKTSSFMNLIFPVRPEKKDGIPAVTHVDGTARVHTVSRATNFLFWNLIHEFETISGTPVLLNTSFNENEPIVCTPADALDCFSRTKMDVLVLGPYWVEGRKN